MKVLSSGRATTSLVGGLAVLLFATGSPALGRPSEAANQFSLDGPVRVASAFGRVTSTLRSVAHNKAVGGQKNSFHLYGRAIDVARFPGVSHAVLTTEFQRRGYRLIEAIDEGDHSHLAFSHLVSLKSGNANAGSQPAKAPPSSSQTKITEAATFTKNPRLAADEHGSLIIDLQP